MGGGLLVGPPILALLTLGAFVGWLWLRKPYRLAGPASVEIPDSLPGFVQPSGSSIGTLVVGPDRCVLDCNDAFCSFFDTTQKDMVGRRITTLFRRSLASHVRQPELLENSLLQEPAVAGKGPPLTLTVSAPGRKKPLRLLHATAAFNEGALQGMRVEYFINISEISEQAPGLRVRPLQGDALPARRTQPGDHMNSDDLPVIHVDSSLCLTSLNSSAVSLLAAGEEEGPLLGSPLSSSAGWLGDTSLLAEIRKALRGGGTSQIRRQLGPDGGWVDISIAPTSDGVLLTVQKNIGRTAASLPRGPLQKQGELFAKLSLSSGARTRTTKGPGRRGPQARQHRATEQTEFFFQPPPNSPH